MLEQLKERFRPGNLRQEVADLKERLTASVDNQVQLEESLALLEQQLIEQGWVRLFGGSGKELNKAALDTLYDLARVYWMKNPLIKRTVEVQDLYVFAQGMTIRATHPDLDQVVQKFSDDPKNFGSFTSYQAWKENDRDLALSGNFFAALFTTPGTGRVIVRTIPLYEITQIVSSPDDRKDVWYYLRAYTANEFNIETGTWNAKMVSVYHPDWRYLPKNRPETINRVKVRWDAPVYHAKINSLPDMRYGLPDVYASIDWAQAYKQFLENWSKLVAAYARIAHHLTTRGGATKVAAAKQKFQDLFGKSDPTTETSLESAMTTPTQRGVGGILTTGEGVKFEAIRTAGATTKAEDARQLRLMVASSSGIVDQILAGDPSTGNLATAKAMERPMELQFRDRQQFWTDVWWDILQYAIDQAIKAGKLKGKEEVDDITGETRYFLDLKGDDGKPVPRTLSIKFPPILEHDVEKAVGAIVSAATLDGKPLAGTMDLKTVSAQLMQVLNVENAETLLDRIFPQKKKGEDILVMQTDQAMVEMVCNLMKSAGLDPWALAEPETYRNLIRFLKDQEGSSAP